MIGIVFDDVVYLTTDAETRKPFVAEKCKPFSFKKRSTVVTGWYALPDRLYDDPEELAQWTRAALGVASPTARKKQAKRPPAAKRARSKRKA
jgi:DNA transformation protein